MQMALMLNKLNNHGQPAQLEHVASDHCRPSDDPHVLSSRELIETLAPYNEIVDVSEKVHRLSLI